MATTVGAGSKDELNRFTGVLMGKFSRGGNGQIVNGLYGFYQGKSTFGINTTDGSAYFRGHIEASSGDIGGWTIAPFNDESGKSTYGTGIYHDYNVPDSNDVIRVGMKRSTNLSDAAFYVTRFKGAAYPNGSVENLFYVTNDG
jgi:hypothetical protein